LKTVFVDRIWAVS